jgi:hypothetical protein
MMRTGRQAAGFVVRISKQIAATAAQAIAARNVAGVAICLKTFMNVFRNWLIPPSYPISLAKRQQRFSSRPAHVMSVPETFSITRPEMDCHDEFVTVDFLRLIGPRLHRDCSRIVGGRDSPGP